MAENNKIYTYERNGKTVFIRRSWRNNENLTNRRNILNDYFKNNKEDIQNMKSYIDVFNDYNNKNPLHKVSYSTIVNKIHKEFGNKNKNETVENDVLKENEESDENRIL